MKPYWSKIALGAWAIVFGVVLGYEVWAFYMETFVTWTFPTISSMLVALIPLPILEALTVIIALVLMWHWWDLKRKQP